MPTIWVDHKPYKVSIVSPLIAREPTHEEWLSYNKERVCDNMPVTHFLIHHYLSSGLMN